MRALVMAAGLGTRLRPLTDTLPKPLVPILGRPMVEYVLKVLGEQGITEAIINIHYLPEKMLAFVDDWNARGDFPRLRVQDEVSEILDTGGAVVKAAPWLFEKGGTALVCNSDVLARPDLGALLRLHEKVRAEKQAECTLAVVRHPEAGAKYTGLRLRGNCVVAFERPGQPDPNLWHFPGFYVVESAALKRLPAPGTPFSIVEKLWKPLAAEEKLAGWEYAGSYRDLGTVADLRAAEAELLAR